tara:strand:+ start:165 stop:365 length:201 start_codon:yes stop_codon:yes gene_type:complete
MPVYGMNLDPFGLQKYTQPHPRPSRVGHKHHSLGDVLGAVGSSLKDRVVHTAHRLGNKGSKEPAEK